MKYGILATTRPDSMWGRTERWRCDRYGRPLAFDTAEEALEAAKAFNDQRGPLCPAAPLSLQPGEGGAGKGRPDPQRVHHRGTHPIL